MIRRVLEAEGGGRWLPIPGWEDYWVSDDGRISKKGGPGQGELRQNAHGKGYRFVSLRRPGCRQKHTVYVHLAMLEAFVGPKPQGPHHGHHKNEVRDDNRLENLAWEPGVNQFLPSYYEAEAERYE